LFNGCPILLQGRIEPDISQFGRIVLSSQQQARVTRMRPQRKEQSCAERNPNKSQNEPLHPENLTFRSPEI
jgi:hypothetical protein